MTNSDHSTLKSALHSAIFGELTVYHREDPNEPGDTIYEMVGRGLLKQRFLNKLISFITRSTDKNLILIGMGLEEDSY
jgi:hypothetical protein